MDWSSDVCSSDLRTADRQQEPQPPAHHHRSPLMAAARPRSQGSDAPALGWALRKEIRHAQARQTARPHAGQDFHHGDARSRPHARRLRRDLCPDLWRSEEHTSELQSLMRSSYAVFCLKKKNTNNTKTITKSQSPTQTT